MRMPGRGLIEGLKVTWGNLTRRSVTSHYPDQLPLLPARSRGVIALMEENCTVCMLCARECPSWCIYIDSHKEAVPAETPGGRERSHNILDRFAIDFSLCMYCSICIEVCPFDALFWTPEFEYAEFDIRELTHERDRLREWMWTVPPPPALDPHAPEPKELSGAVAPTRSPRARTPETRELPAVPHDSDATRVLPAAEEPAPEDETKILGSSSPRSGRNEILEPPSPHAAPEPREPAEPSDISQPPESGTPRKPRRSRRPRKSTEG